MAADVRRITRRPVGTAARAALSSRSRCVASMARCALRGYDGCEVMAFSNVILSRRDAVGCRWFEPIYRLDAQGREPPRSFYRAA
jgi:hypothetical protein